MAKKPGRPSTYTDAIADEICERISEGEPLAQMCRDEHMPGLRTVYDWMESDPNFSARIARARTAGYDMIATEALRIADTPEPGKRTKRTEDGFEEWEEDMLGHRKLRVHTRLQLLAKWDPKRYGERQQLDHSSSDGSMSPKREYTEEELELARERLRAHREISNGQRKGLPADAEADEPDDVIDTTGESA